MNHPSPQAPDAALIDEMDLPSLRAYAHHMNRLTDRLMAEREGHLRQVEQAFRRRHNEQQTQIAQLEARVAGLTNKQRKSA